MGITTKGGDGGETDIFLEGELSRALKSEMVFEVLGGLDELNSFMGVAKCHAKDEFKAWLEGIQADLTVVGGMVSGKGKASIGKKDVKSLEERTGGLEKRLGEMKGFVYPGGSEASACLDVCRSVCRRVERSVIRLNESVTLNREILIYLNRLSDLLFLMARAENKGRGIKESGSWKD